MMLKSSFLIGSSRPPISIKLEPLILSINCIFLGFKKGSLVTKLLTTLVEKLFYRFTSSG